MNMSEAISILGINNTYTPIRNMATALSLHSWNNTAEDEQRLAAAKYVLRRWTAYQLECNERRPRPQIERFAHT